MRYVVEYAAENVVVRELKERAVLKTRVSLTIKTGRALDGLRANKYQHLAENVDHQVWPGVYVVERRVFSQYISYREENSAERMESNQGKAFVTTEES